MNTFTRLELDIKTQDGQQYVSLRGEFASSRIPYGQPKPDGLHSVWFVLTREDVEAIVSGKRSAFQDGYHHLQTSGELWTFYDLDGFHRADRGNLPVPYARVQVPHVVSELILRHAKRVWSAQSAVIDEETKDRRGDRSWQYAAYAHTLDLTHHLERWSRLYGQGKGEVRLVMTDDCRAMFDAALDKGNFRAMLERITAIARNQTYSARDVVELPIYKDSYRADDPAFTWRAGGMFGGLINHGRDGAYNWSIHT